MIDYGSIRTDNPKARGYSSHFMTVICLKYRVGWRSSVRWEIRVARRPNTMRRYIKSRQDEWLSWKANKQCLHSWWVLMRDTALTLVGQAVGRCLTLVSPV